MEQSTTDNEVAEVKKDDSEEPTDEANEGAGDAENDFDDGSKAQMGQGGSFAYDAANGAFPNMGFAGTGDFSQMQMMLAMQNGMQPGAFGGFPMMGTCSSSYRLCLRIDTNILRHARDEHGSYGNAEHVHEHERWLQSRHGH